MWHSAFTLDLSFDFQNTLMRNSPKSFPVKNQQQKPASHKRPSPPLADSRYLELMQKASSFFANSERDVDAEKAKAITEILTLMAEYGITATDLQ